MARGTAPKAKQKLPSDSDGFLTAAGPGRNISCYGKNKTVFSQGDVADSIFYIQKGKVKVVIVSEQGKEAVVAILGMNEFFGEGCLVGQKLRASTITTMTDSVIMKIESAAVFKALEDEPGFARLLITYLLTRAIRVEANLVDQLFNSSEKRLARLLLTLANFGTEGKPEPVITKISQETLAEMIGTTRARVSFFMNKFRKLGFIDYNKNIHVHASLLNAVLRDRLNG
jgi:CRP/FNR family transcriptional regulator, cyclic AMP receptor protein